MLCYRVVGYEGKEVRHSYMIGRYKQWDKTNAKCREFREGFAEWSCCALHIEDIDLSLGTRRLS